MIKKYDSIPEFVEFAKSRGYQPESESEWYGYATHAKVVSLARSGDDTLVPDAEKLLDMLDANVEIARPEWMPTVAGAYANVPEFLAGTPECMRIMQPVASDYAPVNIYVSTTCSAGIKTETMLKRGVAILALVLKLSQMRPVKLYLLAETHGQTDGEYLQVIGVDSAPLNVSVACHALTHVGFARHLTYGVAHKEDGFNGCWPDKYAGGGAPWEAHVREVLDMNPQDIYIGAARLWDEMIKEPVAWVNKQIARFTERES